MVDFEVRVEKTGQGWIGAVLRDGKLLAITIPHEERDAVMNRLVAVEKIELGEQQPFQEAIEAAIEVSGSSETQWAMGVWEGDDTDLKWSNLELRGYTQAEQEVMKAVFEIPKGEVRTYGQVADSIRRPRAARFVGNVMKRNRLPLVIPCHRVVASRGMGYYGGADNPSGVEIKRRLLATEGVKF